MPNMGGYFQSGEEGLFCHGCGLSFRELAEQKRDWGTLMTCAEAQRYGQAMAERCRRPIRWYPKEYLPSPEAVERRRLRQESYQETRSE